MRLAKLLAAAGVASRRASEEVIRAGRVTVNGETVLDPARDAGPDDAVTVDGRPLGGPEAPVVYAVNKPLGVVCTARDPQRRPTIVSLVDSDLRLYPVGRLDIDSTGLILLTNDGELAHRLTHPRFEVPRTYRATVGGAPIGTVAIAALRRGVELEDGPTAPARVRRVGVATIELTIHEGRNRQVRRMCAAVGHPVRSLTRVAFGPLALGDLPSGAHRRLDARELDALSRAGRSARRDEVGSNRARTPRSDGKRSRAGRPRAAGS